MNFITTAKLNKDIVNNIYKIPHDIDLIVGIPRSGMLVATLIALYLNKPLTDINSYVEGKIMSVGKTKNVSKCITSINDVKKALIVEDSSDSGKSITDAKEKISNIKYKINNVFLAAYVTEKSKNNVDLFFNIIEQPRVFEWNFMHHQNLINACIDIDGVLCQDPTNEENDDGEKYKNFLLNAKPKYIPTCTAGYIVTSRLEKYRKETEEWLKKYNISYKKLYMMNIETAEERRMNNNHGEFKANVYKKIKDANWFIESEAEQAKTISKLTGKEVFCIESEIFYEENIYKKYKKIFKDKTKKIIKKVIPNTIINKIKKIRSKNK